MGYLERAYIANNKGDVQRYPAKYDYSEVITRDGNDNPTQIDFYAGGAPDLVTPENGGLKVMQHDITWTASNNEDTLEVSIFPQNLLNPNA